MGKFKFKKAKGLKQIKKTALYVVAEIVDVVRSSDSNFIMTDDERVLLEQIAGKVGNLYTAVQPERIEQAKLESKAHPRSTWRALKRDTATIRMALLNENRKKWIAPLLGGTESLWHVLDCRMCQLLVKDAAQISAEEQAEIVREFEEQGVTFTRNEPGLTLKEAVAIRKPQ